MARKHIEKGNLIYAESIPPMILKSSMHSYRGVMANVMFMRLMAVIFIGGAIYFYFIYDAQHPPAYRLFVYTLILIGGVLMFFVSEFVMRLYRESSYPVKIFSNGIQLYAYTYQKLKGWGGFIPRDDIIKFKVIRGNGYFYSPTPKTLDKYREAPIEMTIFLKNGEKKHIEMRFPPEVLKMRDILRSNWQMEVEDGGEGLGTVETIRTY